MLDLNKPMQTRDGREVLWVHEIEDDPDYSFIAGYIDSDGKKSCSEFTKEGAYWLTEESIHDLINVTEWEYWGLFFSDARIVLGNSAALGEDKAKERYVLASHLLRRPKGSIDPSEWEIVPA